MSFLLAQAERLRGQRADADGRRIERLARRRGMGREGEPGLRALVIDEQFPWAGLNAGAQAVLSHIRALQRLGHAVSVVASEEMAPAEAAVAALTAAGVAVCRLPFYASVEDVLGGDMPQAVRRLAGPRVNVVGYVGDLGAQVLDRVRVSVAPLRDGAGVKGKVPESSAGGVPCEQATTAALQEAVQRGVLQKTVARSRQG
jgi:hypothetical protein